MSDPLHELFADQPALLDALDNYAAHAAGSPSRAEVVTRIVRDWLGTNGYLRSDPMKALEKEVGEFPVEINRDVERSNDGGADPPDVLGGEIGG